MKLWRDFVKLFNHLPVSALIEDKILCMHGGLSPQLKRLNDINNVKRPGPVPERGLHCDLLWSDPASGAQAYAPGVKSKGWGPNDRGTSYVFSEKVVAEFVK